jgi:hypothetical protein
VSATETEVESLSIHFAKAVDEVLLKSIVLIIESTGCRFHEKICAILKGMLSSS